MSCANVFIGNTGRRSVIWRHFDSRDVRSANATADPSIGYCSIDWCYCFLISLWSFRQFGKIIQVYGYQSSIIRIRYTSKMYGEREGIILAKREHRGLCCFAKVIAFLSSVKEEHEAE